MSPLNYQLVRIPQSVSWPAMMFFFCSTMYFTTGKLNTRKAKEQYNEVDDYLFKQSKYSPKET